MRKCAILLLLWGIAFPAMAAKIMSIDQMEQLLIKLHGKPDGKVAGELEDAQLTERVSPARLARWEASFPGKRTQEELMKLADMTAFLNPPASDVLRDPPPDIETQQRMVSLALDYVRTTITHLPNFYATRETTHFEDTPSQQMAHATGPNFPGVAATAVRAPGVTVSRTDYKSLHSTGATSATVTYRDGHEVRDTGAAKGKMEDQPALGLTTSGEFGPILGVVMGDVVQSQVTWLRWEPGVSEPAGVFRYTVPQDHSNYAVRKPNGAKIVELYPGYHGEIVIDPATGEILRLSVVAELLPPYEMIQAAILVEYAPVLVGDRTYICPVRGVAYSTMPVPNGSVQTQNSMVTVQTQLNDVAFTHYHLFRADAHTVAAGSGSDDARPHAPSGTSAPGATPPASRPQ